MQLAELSAAERRFLTSPFAPTEKLSALLVDHLSQVLSARMKRSVQVQVETCTAQDAIGVALLRLLVPVVAALAQALQVAVVEEHANIAAVRPDVIDHLRRNQLAQRLVHAAQRVGAQLLSPELAPG